MNLAGKTYLVTGSTDGIGRHTAEKLVRHGAAVIIHGRSVDKVKETSNRLAELGKGTVTGVVADLASLQQVEGLATQVKEILGDTKLTALVNNAGVYSAKRATTQDGLELTFGVNVAAPFLLTSLLLPSVAERVVNVASISAASSIDFDNLQQERGYSAHGAYSLSKLCNILFSMELGHRLRAASSPVTSNALDPGTVNTKMLYAGWGPIGMRLEDANDEFFVSTISELDGVTNEYFVGGRSRRAPAPAYDAKARRKLWDVLCDMTGAVWDI